MGWWRRRKKWGAGSRCSSSKSKEGKRSRHSRNGTKNEKIGRDNNGNSRRQYYGKNNRKTTENEDCCSRVLVQVDLLDPGQSNPCMTVTNEAAAGYEPFR